MNQDRSSSETLLPFIEGIISGQSTGRLSTSAPEPVPGLIAALNRLADELDRQREIASNAAESAHQTKSDFLTSMSHEVRTPLNAIMGMNQLLTENEDDSEKRQYLTVQRKACSALLAQIESVLDISNLEAGRLELESEEFHPETILDQAIHLLSSRAEEKGLSIQRSFSSRLPETAIGDPRRLQQVLVHLIDNAIKFTERGEIEISVEPDPGPSRFQFCVRDTGIGIPRDQWEIIFESFARADESMTRRYGGTGMGLAICSRLVPLMGGRIWVDSEVGTGSTFYFSLPLTAKSRRPRRYTGMREVVNVHAATAPAPERISDPERALRVLVVEDNPDNQLLIKAYLHKTRHQVDLAADGQAGLDSFRAAEYDLVLMDIQMPVMDGLMATKKIRAWELQEIEEGRRRKKTSIYALTAHAFKAEMLKSREAGCDRHITKPLSKADFLQLIDELL